MIVILGFCVCAHGLILAAAVFLAGIRALNRVLPRPLTYGHLLGIGRTLAVSVLVLPGLALWHGGSELSPLRAQIWAAPSMQTTRAMIAKGARIDLGVHSEHALVPVDAAACGALLILTFGLVVTLLPLIPETRAMFRAIRNAHVVRSIGSVRILVSDTEQVPFAAWIPGRSFIVLPAAFLLRPGDIQHALRHEGQHHRQGDTRFLYAAILAVRSLASTQPFTGSHDNCSSCRSSPAMKRWHGGRVTVRKRIAPACYVSRRPR